MNAGHTGDKKPRRRVAIDAVIALTVDLSQNRQPIDWVNVLKFRNVPKQGKITGVNKWHGTCLYLGHGDGDGEG